MPLTDPILTAKPSTKPVRMFDGGGLYLEVSPAGGKLWRLKYRFNGKEKRLALGLSRNWPKGRAWQSALIRNWKPWEQSTGPKSAEGKAVLSRNAYKGGVRPMLRQLAALLK